MSEDNTPDLSKWSSITKLFSTSKDANGVSSVGAGLGALQSVASMGQLWLGYAGLQEAKRSRKMQEKYAALNSKNKAGAFNQQLKTIARNQDAINGTSEAASYIDKYEASGQVS